MYRTSTRTRLWSPGSRWAFPWPLGPNILSFILEVLGLALISTSSTDHTHHSKTPWVSCQDNSARKGWEGPGQAPPLQDRGESGGVGVCRRQGAGCEAEIQTEEKLMEALGGLGLGPEAETWQGGVC